jgi:aspartate/methionine/tyrosine aminotransferase
MYDLLGFEYDKNQVGMFVWAKINDDYDHAEHFSDDLLNDRAVFLTPGSIFGTNGEQYVRISLCADAETLARAKERIGEFVEKK